MTMNWLLTECEDEPFENLFSNQELNLQKIEEQKVSKRDSNMRYLDNRASNHMIGQRSIFSNLNERITWTVILENGLQVYIKGNILKERVILCLNVRIWRRDFLMEYTISRTYVIIS